MLLDPRWDKTPSMAGFALFVASKDPNQSYNWRNCHDCAVGQYLQSIGKYTDVGQWTGELDDMNQLARGAHGPDIYSSVSSFSPPDWTFGALADRILDYQMAA